MEADVSEDLKPNEATPADDALGYAPFAAKLAEALIRLKPKSGLVLALYGSWGGGKSTMLNFVAKDLDSRPKDEQPIIIRFNPWWFSGQADLVGLFFEALITGLKLDSLADKVLAACRTEVYSMIANDSFVGANVHRTRDHAQSALLRSPIELASRCLACI
jgi:predicted KAP-like P-loop ATPase